MMQHGRGIGVAARQRSTWVVLLSLVLGVLLPGACIVWFMTEAARNQADAARQRVTDAQRGQLRLLRDRFDGDWTARIGTLADAGGGAAAFHRLVASGAADAVVFYEGSGVPRYPAPARATRAADPVQRAPEWAVAAALEASGSFAEAASAYAAIAARPRDQARAARAAQAHIRVLAAAGERARAAGAIDRYLSSGRLAGASDRYGRSLEADVLLFALRLMSPGEERFHRAAARLAALLNSYDVPMPSTQRLFVMGEVAAIPGVTIDVPTHAAERLAASFLEADGVRPAGPMLEPSRLSGVWKLAVGADAVALFRTETIVAAADRLLHAHSTGTGTRFALVPPGHDAGLEAIAAGPMMPGWLLSVASDSSGNTGPATAAQTAAYLWAGSGTVAGLAIAGLLLWQTFRRQVRVSRLKTDLVAAVSHELKTPLASMQALVDVMLETPNRDPARTQEYLELLAGENARLTGLIEHFLAFSRVDRNGHPLVFRDVDVAELVRRTVASPHGRTRFPGLALSIEPELPPLYGDEDALRTVLVNLLENAYKYTGDHKQIALTARRRAGHVVIAVQDNGIGIARRDRRRIFQPFFQVDQRLARERGGCGLGLSIVDFIVRAHGGLVQVESEPGAGSVFTVTLPARASGCEAVA